VIGKHRRSKRWIQGGREPRRYQWQYHRRLRFENRILQNAILKYDPRRASSAAATSTTWFVLCVSLVLVAALFACLNALETHRVVFIHCVACWRAPQAFRCEIQFSPHLMCPMR
jgi:hypothetical protein